jgi:hypothetical protein
MSGLALKLLPTIQARYTPITFTRLYRQWFFIFILFYIHGLCILSYTGIGYWFYG